MTAFSCSPRARRRLHLLLVDVTALMCMYLTLLAAALYWYSLVGGGDGSPLLLLFVAWYMAWAFLPKRNRRHRRASAPGAKGVLK